MIERTNNESFDPQNWEEYEELLVEIVRKSVGHIKTVNQRPVWKELRGDDLDRITQPIPMNPTPLKVIYDDFENLILPYSMGNSHPRFFGWYMGSGTLTGAIADFLSAVEGSNLGGGNYAASRIDNLVVGWLRTLMEFPESASGTLTSGGSMANMVGLTVARNAMLGSHIARLGLIDLPARPMFYASSQVHICHKKCIQLLGFGEDSLVLVETDDNGALDCQKLIAAIEEDKIRRRVPICIIGSAGTTNTGAFDDISTLAKIRDEMGLWLHIDGCVGGFSKLSAIHREKVDGLELADSIALDLHKLPQVPFEVGCALVRDQKLHRETFATQGEYIEQQSRGAAASDYLFNYGYELSRSFKALKVWMTFREFGTKKIGSLIEKKHEQAQLLSELVARSPSFELLNRVRFNIVCFRYLNNNLTEEEMNAFNRELILRCQESGELLVTESTVEGKTCLRLAICNHRTTNNDVIEAFSSIVKIAQSM